MPHRLPRLAVSQDNVQGISEALQRSLRKLLPRANTQIRIPRPRVPAVLHRRLKLLSYKLQLVKKLKRRGHDSRKQFALETLSRIEEDETYFDRLF